MKVVHRRERSAKETKYYNTLANNPNLQGPVNYNLISVHGKPPSPPPFPLPSTPFPSSAIFISYSLTPIKSNPLPIPPQPLLFHPLLSLTKSSPPPRTPNPRGTRNPLIHIRLILTHHLLLRFPQRRFRIRILS